MRENIFENNDFNMYLEDGVMICVYKKGMKMTLAIAKQIISERMKYAKGRSFPGLVDATNLVSTERSANKFLASEEAMNGIKAGAIYVDNYLVRMLGNVFIKVQKPSVPAQLFTDKEKAIEWLKTYL